MFRTHRRYLRKRYSAKRPKKCSHTTIYCTAKKRPKLFIYFHARKTAGYAILDKKTTKNSDHRYLLASTHSGRSNVDGKLFSSTELARNRCCSRRGNGAPSTSNPHPRAVRCDAFRFRLKKKIASVPPATYSRPDAGHRFFFFFVYFIPSRGYGRRHD